MFMFELLTLMRNKREGIIVLMGLLLLQLMAFDESTSSEEVNPHEE